MKSQWLFDVFWSRLVVFSLSQDLVYTVPIGSMYGTCPYIYKKDKPNIRKYTIYHQTFQVNILSTPFSNFSRKLCSFNKLISSFWTHRDGRSVPSAVPLDNCRVFSSHWRLKGNLERKTNWESFVEVVGPQYRRDFGTLKMLKMLTLNSAW